LKNEKKVLTNEIALAIMQIEGDKDSLTGHQSLSKKERKNKK
jgi:hypothetical protein